MSDFKAKNAPNLILARAPRLHPRPRWGAYSAPPDPLAGGKGLPASSQETYPASGPRYSVPSAPRLVATRPGLPGMSRICATMSHIPATGPSRGGREKRSRAPRHLGGPAVALLRCTSSTCMQRGNPYNFRLLKSA